MANASLWIPPAIHKLPKQIKVGAGKGDCTYNVNRRPLRYCFSAGARAMYVYFFFTTTCFGLYLKSFICFLFFFLKTSLILLYHGPKVKLKAFPVYTRYSNLCSTISHVGDESTSNYGSCKGHSRCEIKMRDAR